MNLDRIGIDCPLYEFDCSDIEFDIGEFYALSPNNGKLTLAHNGVSIGDFTANQQEDETINIVTPTSEDITNAVAGEALLRQQADNTLQSNINAEQLARERADRDIQSVLDGESLARSNADIELQRQIDAIASKSDVVDVVANYAALQAYDTSKLNDNDVVKVLDDETHGDTMTYYRWNKSTSSWSYIGQEAAYYSKSQMDTLLATKQDNLTAGTGIDITGATISADTTILATKSELSNYAEKSDTYTKTEVDNLVEPKLSVEVVENLPATGEENKLYLTEKAKTIQTATGNPITATITDGAGNLSDFKLDGDTYQQTYTGKNLLGLGNVSSENQYGVLSSIDRASNTLTLNGTYSGGGGGYPWISYRDNLNIPAGTYTLSIKSAMDVRFSLRLYRSDGTYPLGKYIDVGNTSATITIDFDCTKVAILIGQLSTGKTYDNYKIENIQLEAGSSVTDFEPYVGGIASPNPDYPQAIQTVTGEQTVEIIGKNLFDKTTVTNGYYIDSSGVLQAGANFGYSDYIKVLGGATYTYSGATNNVGYAAKCAWYDENKIYISSNGFSTTGQLTAPANAKYFRTSIRTAESTGQAPYLDTYQLELGSTATAYTPYSKQTLPISLGSIELCKLGTYQDYIYKDGSDWKVHKAISSVTFDGSADEGWFRSGSTTNTMFVGAINLAPHGIYIPWGAGIGSLSKTNYFTSNNEAVVGVFWVYNNAGGRFQNLRVCIPGTSQTVVADLENWLRTHNVVFKYPTTATDTTITDTNLIAQLEAIRTASLENGSNTLSNSATGSNLAGDMEISYYGYNPTNRYDKWLWLDINNSYEQLGS